MIGHSYQTVSSQLYIQKQAEAYSLSDYVKSAPQSQVRMTYLHKEGIFPPGPSQPPNQGLSCVSMVLTLPRQRSTSKVRLLPTLSIALSPILNHNQDKDSPLSRRDIGTQTHSDAYVCPTLIVLQRITLWFHLCPPAT